jgi:hypothetical protein
VVQAVLEVQADLVFLILADLVGHIPMQAGMPAEAVGVVVITTVHVGDLAGEDMDKDKVEEVVPTVVHIPGAVADNTVTLKEVLAMWF